MKDLKQITVIGLGLLGGSITLAVSRSFPGLKSVGFSHRPDTRQKARKLCVASEVADDLKDSVACADLVILATPIYTFEKIFLEIAPVLAKGCIVTDVGSTKVLPHLWAQKILPKTVFYAGSHPIAGSEQRGVEFARDDLFEKAMCIITSTKKTNPQAVQTLRNFWSGLGCLVQMMNPKEHDRIFAHVSHIPHLTAAALINANSDNELKCAGKGFIDTSRIASGPANIWADVLLANAQNIAGGIDKITAQLLKIKAAIQKKDRKQIEKLLQKAKDKRAALINYKMKMKELL